MKLQKDITSFLKKAKNPLIVILGPTASGKTALSLKIAHQNNGEVISTDSRQLYKGMDIGTDVILPKNQEGITHHMLGITTPDKTITLAKYKVMTLEIIEQISKRRKIPMLVGGTGLYISAIIENYNVPKITPNKKLREKLEKEAKEKGREFVHMKLRKLDKKAAEEIHPNNLRYVIRAIEVAMAKKNNKVLSTLPQQKNPIFETFLIGVDWPRDELYKKVDDRVDSQIKRGLIKEVERLLAKKYDEHLPSMSSLGIKEIIPYLKGEMPLEECLEILKRSTRRYAKRQMTWFRRYGKVKWLTPKQFQEFIAEK